MTIANNVATKFAVAAVAVAMIFSAYAPAAQAQTTEDLQQMINDLLAQVAGLQSQLGQGGVTAPAGAPGVCPYTWTRDLSQGSEGADVMKLQQFLNSNPDTRVSVSGAGSLGMETMYYGPATAAAVSKMQVMYRAEILTPNGLVNPTGYFGASSRAKANDLCIADAGNGGDDMDEDDDMTDEEDEDENFTLRGEASLDNFELDSEESDVEENMEDVAVGLITVEFQDGDAEISRLDVALDAAVANDEQDPWEVFETVSLWVDGDMIAEFDASDEDEYLDEDDGSIRFTDLALITEEDEEVEIIVAVSTMNNLDGLNDGETWTLTAESMRFFDADDVATTENTAGDLGGSGVDFDLEMEGADEELNVSLSSSNPDATDIIVDTDSDTNGVTILVADLEAEDNDMEFDKVVVRVDTGSELTADVIDEIYVVIDGQSFDAEAVSGNGAPTGNDSKNVDANATSTWFVFDIDGDVTIDEDDEVEMEVVVDFNDTDDGTRYSNGTTIKASITSTELAYWDVEGADEVTPDGSAIGDDHILVAEGIVVPVDGFEGSTNTLGDNDTIGEFTLEFEVSAVEGDFYIYNDAASTTANPTRGVAYTVTGGAAVVTASLDSSADEDTVDVFTVREGETETFTLVVTVDPAAAGTFRVGLTEVHYTDDADGETGTVQYDVTPVTDFRTAQKAINN